MVYAILTFRLCKDIYAILADEKQKFIEIKKQKWILYIEFTP